MTKLKLREMKKIKKRNKEKYESKKNSEKFG